MSEPKSKQHLSARIEAVGPKVGLEVLKAEFPQIARGEIREELWRLRRRHCAEHPILIQRLEWQKPARVWAMDFTKARAPVAGRKEWILTVRDLASGCQLLFMALESQQAAGVVRELGALLLCYGPPLLMKVDNGSSFIAEATRSLLGGWGVEILFSPPRRPSYNGAIEASNGRLKDLAAWQAERDGHPQSWTSDELERSRNLANQLSRPRGHGGQVAEMVWRARSPITGEERLAFQARVAAERSAHLAAHHREHGREPGVRDRARLERKAIERALCELGILLVRRKEIPLPLKFLFRAKNR
jgi:transposase InsO family protein